MNRKEFLVQIGSLGGFTALAPCCALAADLTPATAGTQIDKRMAFAQTWAKRMLDNLDAEVDEPTRKRLLQANGRTCYRGAKREFHGTLDEFIEAVKKWVGNGPMPIRREGDIVYFDYVQNPDGLKTADGWCLCPIVEKGPEGLSGTYCECSVGYVTEMFTGFTGKPVRVELLESVKRGGKTCRFKIHLA